MIDERTHPVKPAGSKSSRTSIGALLRCYRYPGIVTTTIRQLAGIVDEIVVVADEVMDAESLGVIRDAGPSKIHRIPHVMPIERSNPYVCSLCAADWLLWIADDEVPSVALLNSLRALVEDRRFTHYWLGFAWLWPDGEHRLDQRPWWPSHQTRLVRNDPALCHYPGVTHGGIDVAGPYRLLLDAAILHLDLCITSLPHRRAKVARYDAERPGVVVSEMALNQVVYLPEDWSPQPAITPLSGGDAAIARMALASLAVDLSRVSPLHLPVSAGDPIDSVWSNRPWSAEAYRARIELAQPERDLEFLVDGGHVVYLAVTNEGTHPWPGAVASSPLIRMAYRVWSPDGVLLQPNGFRTSFPGAVHPGERVVIPAALGTPDPGAFIIEFDMVYEFVSWFNCPLRVPVTVHPGLSRCDAGPMSPGTSRDDACPDAPGVAT